MSANTIFSCTLCERTWDTLPEGAVQITTTKRGGNGIRTTYRFADGSIHAIVKRAAQSAKEKS